MKPVQLILAPTADGNWRTLEVQTLAPRGPRRILVIPGSLVLAHETEALGRTNAQAQAATLVALAPRLSAPADKCVCALGPLRANRRTAFVAARATIDQLLASARTMGFAPEAIVPDFALLPAPETGYATVATGPDLIVRTHTGGFACQPELLDLLLGNVQPQMVAFEDAIVGIIRSGGHLTAPDLTPASRSASPARASRAPWLAGGAVAASLGIFSALPWIEAQQLDTATDSLRREVEATARQALPPGTRLVNALAQLREARVPEAQAANGLDHATVMMEGLALSPGVGVVRLELDEGIVRAHVGVSGTSLLQPLRDHVASRGLILTETPGLSQPNSIPVELQLAAAP